MTIETIPIPWQLTQLELITPELANWSIQPESPHSEMSGEVVFDAEQFATDFMLNSHRMLGIIRKIVGPDDAEDVLMNTYVKTSVAASRGGFADRGYGMSPWLNVAAKRLALDWIKKDKTVPFDATETDFFDKSVSAPSAEDEVIETLYWQGLVGKVMTELEPHDTMELADLIDKVFAQEMDRTDYAQSRGVTRGTVNTRIFRMRRVLANLHKEMESQDIF